MSNREIPKQAMRCIACSASLPCSAEIVAIYTDDRWTLWHFGCFSRRWNEEAARRAQGFLKD